MAELNLQTGHADDGRKAIVLTIVLNDDETLTLAEDLITETKAAAASPARKTAVKKAVARKKTAQKGRTR